MVELADPEVFEADVEEIISQFVADNSSDLNEMKSLIRKYIGIVDCFSTIPSPVLDMCLAECGTYSSDRGNVFIFTVKLKNTDDFIWKIITPLALFDFKESLCEWDPDHLIDRYQISAYEKNMLSPLMGFINDLDIQRPARVVGETCSEGIHEYRLAVGERAYTQIFLNNASRLDYEQLLAHATTLH
jgi:hypothetical protein